MEIYNRIKDLREDKDLKQAEIAEILGMHVTQYRRYEAGEVTVPLWFAVEIAKFYNVTLDYIAGLIPMKETLTRFKK